MMKTEKKRIFKGILRIVFLVALIFLSACSQFKSNQPPDKGTQNSPEDFIDFGPAKEKPSPGVRVPAQEVSIDATYHKVIVHFPQDRKISCYEIGSTTFSMSPFIQDGTKVCLFKPESPEEVHIGDVVMYENVNQFGLNRTFVTHRVINREGSNFTLMGDNVPQQDFNKDTIPFSAIQGVVFTIVY